MSSMSLYFKDRIINYIKMWEARCYRGGIPDKAPRRLEQLGRVPSYRRVCICIMKNDFSLSFLGYEKNKPSVYHELKKEELIERGVIKPDTQLKIF